MSNSALSNVQLPDNPRAIVFINGAIARDTVGCLWLWRNMNQIRSATTKASGCLQVKSGICSPREILMVSYWACEKDLIDFFRGEAHRNMVKFVRRHPDSLCLYNETYNPSKPGKYSHEPQGMALLYGLN